MIILFLVSFSLSSIYSQGTFKAHLKDHETKEPLTGVSVLLKRTGKGVISDANGFIELKNIPEGIQIFIFNYTGYERRIDTIRFPITSTDTFEISLSGLHEELDEVIVQSTRTSRTINNTPTRVETIDAEELDEKNNMLPANVSMLLTESTGIQMQQTSATSGAASIRIQGLDGRYTQLLKDGYPNFGNFASGLSILEIPPFDLKQVEVIKGPASTLYGGGAIAGVVNFISKTPKEKAEYNFLINQSHVGQTNAGIYASQKQGKLGYTVLALVNLQKAYDVDKDGFSELPRSNNFTINPQLFYYPNKTTTLMIGNSLTSGSSKGGDMQVINGQPDNSHFYLEENNTIRNTTTFEFNKKYQNKNSFIIKQSLSIFDRKITIPGYVFSGINTNSFTDISYLVSKQNHTLIGGLNLLFDKFHQRQFININQNTTSFTSGLYVQDTRDVSNKVEIESGIRLDNVSYSNTNYRKNQIFLLPRISALFKISHTIYSRIGGGLGYKIPTIFTEQTETMQYQHVLPLNHVTAEKSAGLTADVTYKIKATDDLFMSINQLFFLTTISHPLVLQSDATGNYYFLNADNSLISRGFETNLKIILKEKLKFWGGYTYTNAKAKYMSGNHTLPLSPSHKLNLSLVYEEEHNFKIGLEGYFTSSQYLYNGNQTPSYWQFGVMAEKTINKISLFVNFENITDERQSKYKRVVNINSNNIPTFDDIWNNVEGFVMNGGIKIKW